MHTLTHMFNCYITNLYPEAIYLKHLRVDQIGNTMINTKEKKAFKDTMCNYLNDRHQNGLSNKTFTFSAISVYTSVSLI